MKTFFILSLLALLPKAYADFERPAFKNSQLMEESQLVEDEKVRANCFVYKKYIIVEKDEPGFLGKTIYYKENTFDKKSSPESYCQDLKLDTFKKLPSSGSNLYGVYRRFIFVQDPDELSARTKFDIYNLETGVMTYSGIKNNNTMMRITPISEKTTSIQYFQR